MADLADLILIGLTVIPFLYDAALIGLGNRE